MWLHHRAILSCSAILILAQHNIFEAGNTAGREYLLAFPETKAQGDVELCIIACEIAVGTNVSIYLRDNAQGVFDNFTLDPNEVEYKTISAEFRLSGSGIGNRSIVVRADRDISLIVFNTEKASTDAFLALPTEALGEEYYVVTWDGDSAEFVICAFENTTRINITLPRSFPSTFKWTNNLFAKGGVIYIKLQPYETLQFQADDDLSGTHIKADGRIAVLSGNMKTSVVNSPTGDHLVEMMVPVSKWGKYFLVVATPERESNDVIKIISSENGTKVVITSDTVVEEMLYRSGDYVIVNVQVGTSMTIVADKCVMVTQFTPSRSYKNEKSDPSMMLVVPVEQYDTKYVFTVYPTNLVSYIVVIVKEGEEWLLMLDGFGMDLSIVQSVRDSGYTTFYNKIQAGRHSLQTFSPNSTFGAWLYGCDTAISYMVPAGMRLHTINKPINTTANSSVSINATIDITNATMDSTNVTMDSTNTTMDSTNTTMDPTNATMESTNTTMDSTNATIDSTNATIDSTNATIDSTNATTDSTNATIDSTNATTDSTNATIDSTNATIDSTNATIDSTNATTDSTNATIDSTNATTDSTNATIDSTNATIDSTNATIDSTNATTDSTNATIDSTNATTDSTNATIDSTNATIDSTNATIDSTNATTDSTNATIDSTNATTDSTNATIDSTNATIDSTNATIDSTNATTDSTNATIDSTNATTDSTNATIDSTNATTDSTNALMNSTNATIQHNALDPNTDCPSCICDQQYNVTYMSNISLDEKIKELINALKLERKSLSSFKRTKISAADKRVSSAAIGSVLGIGVLSAITLIIVLPDVPILGFHFFRFHHTTLSGKSNTAV